MVLSGFFFLSVRIWEIVFTVPVVGMLGSLVHSFVQKNELTPTYILVMFIVATLALAWELFTVLAYLRARHDALFIAFTDLCFFGGFIAGVVLLKFTAGHSCSNGVVVGNITYKPSSCNLLEASFAIGIILVISFFTTFWLALLVHHHHRNDDRVVVKREYSRSSRHGSRHGSSSRDYNRRSRDYDNRPRSSSGRNRSRSRRDPWV